MKRADDEREMLMTLARVVAPTARDENGNCQSCHSPIPTPANFCPSCARRLLTDDMIHNEILFIEPWIIVNKEVPVLRMSGQKLVATGTNLPKGQMIRASRSQTVTFEGKEREALSFEKGNHVFWVLEDDLKD